MLDCGRLLKQRSAATATPSHQPGLPWHDRQRGIVAVGAVPLRDPRQRSVALPRLLRQGHDRAGPPPRATVTAGGRRLQRPLTAGPSLIWFSAAFYDAAVWPRRGLHIASDRRSIVAAMATIRSHSSKRSAFLWKIMVPGEASLLLTRQFEIGDLRHPRASFAPREHWAGPPR